MKNTGKPSEQLFDEAWASLGKRAHVFTFTDSSKAYGQNKRLVLIEAQPSDRILTFEGVISYAEIKSTIDERRFPFGLLRKTQSAYAAGVIAAGGRYDVYIHALAYDQWYRVPYAHIRSVKDGGKSSIPWNELINFSWSLPNV